VKTGARQLAFWQLWYSRILPHFKRRQGLLRRRKAENT